MIKRILVPLDGSELSERAVPWACEIARGLDAAIFLLGVVAPPPGRWGGIFKAATTALPEMILPGTEEDLDRALHPVSKDSQMASMESEVKRVLMPVADRIKEQGIDASVIVGFGRPVDGILQHASEENVDLIVMCTHGRSGLHSYAYGSTADRVAQRAHVPVMLIRPEEVCEKPSLSHSSSEAVE